MEASIDDPYARESLNWWTGFTLLIAVGTLNFITLVHILPEVFFQSGDGHEDHDHFGNDQNHDHDLSHVQDGQKNAEDYQQLDGESN